MNTILTFIESFTRKISKYQVKNKFLKLFTDSNFSRYLLHLMLSNAFQIIIFEEKN